MMIHTFQTLNIFDLSSKVRLFQLSGSSSSATSYDPLLNESLNCEYMLSYLLIVLDLALGLSSPSASSSESLMPVFIFSSISVAFDLLSSLFYYEILSIDLVSAFIFSFFLFLIYFICIYLNILIISEIYFRFIRIEIIDTSTTAICIHIP